MNREELKDEAKRLGLRVRDNFLDDWLENVCFGGFGIFLGWIAGRYL